ncbi:MAG: hypothetical protein GWN00_08895, partial [Aliifodinibius sp.]|nr:hypothetical protein [Fodinibius sp.]NIV11295.1 hypothetical protein [Fodinibius sp.]NIY24917.1 hypothetical protein [Fodinibius sp.]
HWHGAKADRWFSHISVEIPGVERENEWLEPVSNEYYSTFQTKGNKNSDKEMQSTKKYSTKKEFKKVNMFGTG